jgi:hypothetical protein
MAEAAERRKLQSVNSVLHRRAERLCSSKPENDQTPAIQLVRNLLSKDFSCMDTDSAHEHADQLEELLPLVADMPYLRAVLTYELAGGDPDESITLSAVFNDAALQKLRASTRAPCKTAS